MNTARKLVSFFLSLLLAAALTVTIAIASTATMLSEENTAIITDRVFESLETDDLALRTASGKKSISSVLLAVISDCPGASHITEKQIAESLTPKFLMEFTEELLEEFYDPSVTDPIDIGLRPSAIYKFLEKNQKTLSSLAAASGYSGNIDVKGNKELILNQAARLMGKNGVTVDCLLADGALKDNLGIFLEAGRSLLTPTVLLIACGVSGFIALLLLAVCFGYFDRFLSACGKPAFWVGFLSFFSALAIRSVILSGNPAADGVPDYILFPIGLAASVIMDFSIIVLIAGILLLIAAVCVKRMLNGK
jgi:hypothetical protein